MKKFFLFLYVVAIIVFLIGANMYWQREVTYSSAPAEGLGAQQEGQNASNSQPDVAQAVKNWPKDAQQAYAEAREAGVPYKIMIAGSPSLGKETGGWSTVVKQKLEETLGKTVTVEIQEFNGNSMEFMKSDVHNNILAAVPDLVLYESFLLKDNGVLDVNTHQQLLTQFNQELQKANEKAVLMVQPAHPIFGAQHYPNQKEAEKQFAQENSLRYIDHWEVWPGTNDQKLTGLITEDQSTPNEKGHELWAEYLVDELISN
ncbi:SGNH/GDSL hydrolase family protein [Bacillus thermotolerans]|uniref:SGNH/GDSL hydrolase family protein n=1 Tax=Bacillus thermotolerans TaxID=1221996 RepID=A0A0F5I5U8_BACTR|nr:SGNH/GDSL hydrolase family protein [Bacillus thermotolerans]KKB40921.1 hypothetical protein QY95_00984 [Bacillus thermotolerans]